MLAPAPGRMVTSTLRLVRELGVGGMGHVWVADHLVLGIPVAVKFLAPELALDPKAISRFSREAVAASDVRSAHVVEILDHGVSDDGPPYLVMELLEGTDLADYLKEHRALPPAKVAHVVGQVAEALERAHELGVIHRDVKPSNIFLTDPDSDRPIVKVLDFGIAKTTSPDRTATATGQAIGTIHYMSPEQVVAKPVDHRTDIWSLGVVAFEALTGTIPFDLGAIGALALALHTVPLPKPSARAPALGARFDAWFQRACAREAADRFATMTELSRSFDAAVGAADTSHVVHVDAAARAFVETEADRTMPRAARTGECLLALPSPLVPVTRVRSTTLSAALLVIEERGMQDAYYRALPAQHHDALRSLVFGQWLPIEVGMAHYAALEALGLSPIEMVRMGRDVGGRLHGTFLEALVSRLGAGSLATPWAVFKLLPKAWERAYDGGSIGVWKLGEREARIEVHGLPSARFGYVRHAMRGTLAAALETLLSVKSHVQLVPGLTTEEALAYRVAWV